jgi:hypothetical protein
MRITMCQLAGSSQPQPYIVILLVEGQGQGTGSVWVFKVQVDNYQIEFMS